MIQSMTGYGETTVTHEGKKIQISIKSLNSKSLSLRLKTPDVYASKEMEVRKLLSDQLYRGRINLRIHVKYTEQSTPDIINESLVESYYNQLSQLAHRLEAPEKSLFELTLQMPEVIQPEEETLDQQEWKKVYQGVQQAIQQLKEFREKEGKSIEQKLSLHLQRIEKGHTSIQQQAPQRTQRIRQKLEQNLESFVHEEEIDDSRLEQELVYYMDKMDISEENQRLGNHIAHFQDTLQSSEPTGKKLDFIAQEMHREINTLGAKANDSMIQKQVVQMKDELSKIREQVFNVL